MLFDLDPKIVKIAMQIYTEHVEIIKKKEELKINNDLRQHEIALHYKNIYDNSIDLARAILNQSCQNMENDI